MDRIGIVFTSYIQTLWQRRQCRLRVEDAVARLARSLATLTAARQEHEDAVLVGDADSIDFQRRVLDESERRTAWARGALRLEMELAEQIEDRWVSLPGCAAFGRHRFGPAQ